MFPWECHALGRGSHLAHYETFWGSRHCAFMISCTDVLHEPFECVGHIYRVTESQGWIRSPARLSDDITKGLVPLTSLNASGELWGKSFWLWMDMGTSGHGTRDAQQGVTNAFQELIIRQRLGPVTLGTMWWHVLGQRIHNLYPPRVSLLLASFCG